MCYQDTFNKRSTTIQHFIYLYRTCVCKLTGYFSEALLLIAHAFFAVIYFSDKLACFNWSKNWKKITPYLIKSSTDNSKAACPITFFCPCNAAHHHPSKLHSESSSILSPFPRLHHLTNCKLHRGQICDTFTYKEKQWLETHMQKGSLNYHTSWQGEQERNPKSSSFLPVQSKGWQLGTR